MQEQKLRYFQVKERSDEHSYDFEADYVLVESTDALADSETNSCISGFVMRSLEEFRADALATTPEKIRMKETAFAASAYDSLLISYNTHLFSARMLSLEFQVVRYAAGAAHPHHSTKTLNFCLHPSQLLDLAEIFKDSSNYLSMLSAYCIRDLNKQRAQLGYGNAGKQGQDDPWILSGASPEYRNYHRFNLNKNGIVIHFDPYQVGSYAEGEYEVFVPRYELQGLVRHEIATLLGWV